jgi:hypothetical protein
VNPTKNWIIVALILLPFVKDASLGFALSVGAFLYWAWGDEICVLPLLVYAITHAKGWARCYRDRVESKRRERQRVKERQEWNRRQRDEADRKMEEERRRQKKHAKWLASQPPPPTPKQVRAREVAEAKQFLKQARRRLSEEKQANAEAGLSEIRQRHLDNLAELEYAKAVKRIRVQFDKLDN